MKKFLLSALFALLLPWQVEAGTVVFHDTFVDTGGTNIEDHTPDTVGTSWTIVSSSLTQEVEIVGASSYVKAFSDAFNQGAFFSADPAPTAADTDVEMDLEGLDADADDAIWIVWRYQDVNNWYAVFFRDSSVSGSTAFIYKCVSGTVTSLGNGLAGVAGTETIKLQVRGSDFDFFVDSGSGYGSSVLTISDSSISAAGKTGLAWAGWHSNFPGFDLSVLNIVTEFKVTEFPAATAFLPGASLF